MIYVLMITRGDRNTLLKRAVASVLVQTGAAFKLLLVENGVRITDIDTVEVLTDPRVERITTPQISISEARNLMAARANPDDQLIVVDDDDYLLPEALKSLLVVLPPGGLAYGNCLLEKSDGKMWLRHSCSAEFSKENMLKVSCIFHPAMISKALFTRLGGLDVTLPRLQTYDFYLRLSELPDAKRLVYHLRRPLYVYNDLDGHTSTRSAEDKAHWIQVVRDRATARRAAAVG